MSDADADLRTMNSSTLLKLELGAIKADNKNCCKTVVVVAAVTKLLNC